jgi:hypothetical protein
LLDLIPVLEYNKYIEIETEVNKMQTVIRIKFDSVKNPYGVTPSIHNEISDVTPINEETVDVTCEGALSSNDIISLNSDPNILSYETEEIADDENN